MRAFRSAALFLALATAAAADESSWSAASPFAQLSRDPTLLPKGKGMLFIPTMTLPIGNEPKFQVFRDGREVRSASPGRRLPLDPGLYQVRFGSGNLSQLIRKNVPIFEGETTMLKPTWSALVIDVIDQTRTSVNESYELFDESGESYGPGFGIEEERGERVRTWILRPGVYSVVRLGDSFATIDKFSVQVLPGIPTQRNLVYNSEAGEFTSFYQRPQLHALVPRATSAVLSQTELSGSVRVNTSQKTAGDNLTSANLALQLFNHARYNTDRHYASLRVLIEQGASWQESQELQKGVDRAESRATYIYRLSPRIGPYLRGVIHSNVFPSETRFRMPRDLIRTASNGRVDTLEGITRFTTAPSLSPITFREGIGINSRVFRYFALNTDLRLGIGALQELYKGFFDVRTDSAATRAIEFKSSSTTGFEALVILDARLSRLVSLDSEFDILMSSRDSKEWFFTWENRLRIALTSFINLDINANLERTQGLRRLAAREQVLLRFSRFF